MSLNLHWKFDLPGNVKFGDGNIRWQFLSKILLPKLIPRTKDVPAPSKFLLGKNLNDRIGTIETSQKMLETYSNSPYYKNWKKKKKQTCKDFQEALEIKTRGATAPPKPEVTLINRVLTITVLQEKLIRYNHYFKVPARDYSIYKERYSEL